MTITIKRIYDSPAADDGFRVLVDRLWPRGVSKENAHIDLWEKNIAPSNELRKWFNHEAEKWPEFHRRYTEELNAMPDEVRGFRELLKDHALVTLLYGAKDETHNQAVVLRDFLKTQNTP
jgi:DNA-3-methyladenine glycosylase